METKTLKTMAADYEGDAGVGMPHLFPPGFGEEVRKACRSLANFFTSYFQRVWAMDGFGKAVEAEGGFETFWRKRHPERAFLLKGLRRSQRERFLVKEMAVYFNAHWEEYRRVS